MSSAVWAESAATILTDDARRHPHQVLLALRLHDGRLRGQAAAQTPSEPIRFALSSYLELWREVARQP